MRDFQNPYTKKFEAAINQIDTILENSDKFKTELISVCTSGNLSKDEARIMNSVMTLMMRTLDNSTDNLRNVKATLKGQ